MIMKTIAILFWAWTGLSILSFYTEKQVIDMEKMSWLLGTWENTRPKGSIFETWTKTNNDEYMGKSYMIKGQDTIVFENIQLANEQTGLFYIPIVKNQNKGLPIRFAAKTISENQLVFENAKHDFPQIISYTKISIDSLIAVISGTKNGKEIMQNFPMKRVR